MPVVTNHARARMRERTGITKGNASAMAKRILAHGIKHSEAVGELKSYMDRVFLSKRTASNLRYYGENLYLFNGDILITVFSISDRINKNLEENVKEAPYAEYMKFMGRKKGPDKGKPVSEEDLIDDFNDWARRAYRNGRLAFIALEVIHMTRREVRISYISKQKSADYMNYIEAMHYISNKYHLKGILIHKRDSNGEFIQIENEARQK